MSLHTLGGRRDYSPLTSEGSESEAKWVGASFVPSSVLHFGVSIESRRRLTGSEVVDRTERRL